MTSDLRQFIFGPGAGWTRLVKYVDGTTPTISQPRRFEVVQEITLEFDLTLEELYGDQIYPVALALGKGKINGKVKIAALGANFLNQAFVGASSGAQSGQRLMAMTGAALGEATTVPAATPYQYTVANAATFVADWGVRYGDTGLPLTAVSTVSAAGQYTASAAGVYTFSAADAGRPVYVDYEYSQTGGATLEMANALQGDAAIFSFRYQGIFGGQKIGIYLPNAVSDKFNMQTKMQGFTEPELTFNAFAGPDGTVGYIYLPMA
jgi:hypothetical protein